MSSTSPPAIAVFLGGFVIITIPVAFFVFGWKDIELHCQRTAVGALPTCTVSESFAMKLYTRESSATNVINIGYHTGTVRQASTKTGSVTVHPSTMVFGTTGGDVQIGHATSAIDNSAERELILKTRAFLNAPDVLDFRHESSLHGMFGYVGLAGVVGLLLIFFAVLWHHLRRAWL